MGKIFGISNNPVSTITSVFEPLRIVPPKMTVTKMPKFYKTEDKFVSSSVKTNKSNPVIAMRNGIGRLMSHFSRSKSKA